MPCVSVDEKELMLRDEIKQSVSSVISTHVINCNKKDSYPANLKSRHSNEEKKSVGFGSHQHKKETHM